MIGQELYNRTVQILVDAYFKDEIRPEDAEFCFCGTLCNGRISWSNSSFRQHYHSYSFLEYGLMEKALFSPWPDITWLKNGDIDSSHLELRSEPDYEQKIFDGMCAALGVLKQIHIERGEVIDEVETPFTKRKQAALAE